MTENQSPSPSPEPGEARLTFIVRTPPGSQGLTALDVAATLDHAFGFPEGTVEVEPHDDRESE